MKNFIQEGNRVSVPAPADVLSGAGVLVGSMFGVAVHDAVSGAQVLIQTNGVVSMPKVSAQAWTVGALVYWDNANKLVTTASSGNKLIGVAAEAAANPSANGIVRLNGSFTQ